MCVNLMARTVVETFHTNKIHPSDIATSRAVTLVWLKDVLGVGRYEQ